MRLAIAFTLIIGGVLTVTVAVTGATFSQAIRGQADTSKLHQQAGA